MTSFLLNGISFVVRSFVRSLVSALSFCTVLLYSSVVRTCAVDKKADHGHKKGSRATGTTRGTHPRAPQGREQRDTVLRTKLTAPRIARAPELVQEKREA
jgi:hypothetical protein